NPDVSNPIEIAKASKRDSIRSVFHDSVDRRGGHRSVKDIKRTLSFGAGFELELVRGRKESLGPRGDPFVVSRGIRRRTPIVINNADQRHEARKSKPEPEHHLSLVHAAHYKSHSTNKHNSNR